MHQTKSWESSDKMREREFSTSLRSSFETLEFTVEIQVRVTSNKTSSTVEKANERQLQSGRSGKDRNLNGS